MVQLTETCNENAPHLVLHTDMTPANVHEAMLTEPIHAVLATKDLAPAEHFVDAVYVRAEHIISAQERYGLNSFGPARPRTEWQNRTEDAFDRTEFVVNLGALGRPLPRRSR